MLQKDSTNAYAAYCFVYGYLQIELRELFSGLWGISLPSNSYPDQGSTTREFPKMKIFITSLLCIGFVLGQVSTPIVKSDPDVKTEELAAEVSAHDLMEAIRAKETPSSANDYLSGYPFETKVIPTATLILTTSPSLIPLYQTHTIRKIGTGTVTPGIIPLNIPTHQGIALIVGLAIPFVIVVNINPEV